jgi:hypothetical protein
MTSEALPGRLHQNHRRALAAAFTYVDGLLSEVEAAASCGDSQAVFPTVVRDLAPVQSRVVLDHVARIR